MSAKEIIVQFAASQNVLLKKLYCSLQLYMVWYYRNYIAVCSSRGVVLENLYCSLQLHSLKTHALYQCVKYNYTLWHLGEGQGQQGWLAVAIYVMLCYVSTGLVKNKNNLFFYLFIYLFNYFIYLYTCTVCSATFIACLDQR